MVGFGTFADEVTVDFEGVDVFALVGPTGAGKSTVIDAICFALYGSVPRHDDRRAVAGAVHVQASEAKVALEFDLGDTRYAAVRVIRRDAKGKASTREARLEVVGGDVLAGSAREMEPAVVELLGLDFDQFTRAVVLPQGEFARFLHDKPAARQDLLTQLLGLEVYTRMMQRARATAGTAEAAIAADRARLLQLAGATDAARADAEARAAELDAAAGRWEGVRAALTAARERAASAERDAAAASVRVDALAAVSLPEGTGELAEQFARADAALVAATDELAAAGAELAAADAALAERGAREPLTRALEDHGRLVALDADIAAAAEEVKLATEVQAAATEAADAADEHMESLRTASAAWTVRSHLQAGDTCPVCEQAVATVPEGDPPEAWTGARDAAKAARDEADRAGKVLARAEAAYERAQADASTLRSRLADAPDPSTARQALADLDACAQTVEQARARERAARRNEAAARAEVERLGSARRELRDRYRTVRDGVTAVGLGPPAETDDLHSDWAALVAWASATIPEHQDAAAEAAATAADALAGVRDQLATLAEEAIALELTVDGEVSVDAFVNAARVGAGRARDRAAAIAGELAERERLEAAVRERQDEAAVATTLAGLLDARHFEQWLVAEALARLVDAASARFLELSAGRFSFAFTEGARDLLVVDHGQGDETRSVRTLSGGETFQGSLALALALSDELADAAAGHGARLESIFLDEGFGTLDAETLETVAATIENLGARDRMVGIVTHVPELAARMPVQYRVARHGRSSTVERIDA
jgi:exonuclease SbcC